MAPADSFSRGAGEAGAAPAFLILDAESVPDGRLLARVKYPDENLSPEEAIARAQAEARDRSPGGSDFLPVSVHYPVAVCVLRAGADFGLQELTCLDAPQFRTRRIVEQFWAGVAARRKAAKSVEKSVERGGRGEISA